MTKDHVPVQKTTKALDGLDVLDGKQKRTYIWTLLGKLPEKDDRPSLILQLFTVHERHVYERAFSRENLLIKPDLEEVEVRCNAPLHRGFIFPHSIVKNHYAEVYNLSYFY
jgi:hypothetical protein